jgi:hypothetical protein
MLIFFVIIGCSMDPVTKKKVLNETSDTVLDSDELTKNYNSWPFNGSVKNNSYYYVLVWDDGTKSNPGVR